MIWSNFATYPSSVSLDQLTARIGILWLSCFEMGNGNNFLFSPSSNIAPLCYLYIEVVFWTYVWLRTHSIVCMYHPYWRLWCEHHICIGKVTDYLSLAMACYCTLTEAQSFLWFRLNNKEMLFFSWKKKTGQQNVFIK